jgi:hypothetical protein
MVSSFCYLTSTCTDLERDIATAASVAPFFIAKLLAHWASSIRSLLFISIEML